MSRDFKPDRVKAPTTASPMALDRRARNRRPNPECRSCHADAEHVRATVRSSSRVIFKCEKCGGVWELDVPKRGRW